MSELIARFHDLSFQGVISTDIQDDSYMLFEGRDGEMTIEYRETHCEGDPILRGEATQSCMLPQSAMRSRTGPG